MPDLVMTGVEYVRVRDGEPIVRLQAESAERYEKDRRMELASPRFAQYAHDGREGAVGAAASASVDLASGDVVLSGGVSLSVPSEDLLIETEALTWQDEDRRLFGPADGPVLLKKADGSYLRGFGFEADARAKSWTFAGSVEGTLVEESDEGEIADDDRSDSPAQVAAGEKSLESAP